MTTELLKENLPIYHVNIDYEHQLFDREYNESKNLKFIREFEYLIFYIEKSPYNLSNKKEYSREYLKFLNHWGLIIPKMTKLPGTNWWGKLEDVELEKVLNSKITSSKILSSILPSFPQGIAETKSDLEYFINLFGENLLLRSPYSFSGRGHSFLTKSNNTLFPVVVAPVLDRLLDLGIFLSGQKDMKTYINLNDERGQFRGGVFAKNQQLLVDYLDTNFSFSNYLDTIAKLYQEYEKIKLNLEIQFDCFFYREGRDVKFYPLVEANYRKTMGQMLLALAQLVDKDWGAWVLIPRKSLEPSREPLKIIDTSPSDSIFAGLLLVADDLNQLKEEFRGLLNLVSREEAIKLSKINFFNTFNSAR